MADITSERVHVAQDHSPALAETNRRKQQTQQPRQLLSCTKCRERKVKCDRTKPCSACCARGSPRDCHFIAEDGNYAPIQQSYELRKLRSENLRLKERLRACKIPIDDDEPGHEVSLDSPLSDGTAPSQRRRAMKQKRFQGSEWQDSIYFGSPGLATVVRDFTSADVGDLPLSYTMPRGSDMFRSLPTYPFPTLFSATPDECFPQLLSCLPAMEELVEYLGVFQNLFSQVPVEMTRNEIEAFLSEARKNSKLYPANLALLFGLIALGAQHSAWERGGKRWDANVIEVETKKGNVYIAAAMQALRQASFTHKPSLSVIQTLLMIGSYLTNNGRMLDSFTLFGTTIRLAHSIGLHRHPKYLNPAPTTEKDCAIRQKVWWHMLDLDVHMSMTLGRPLGISGIGDNPWPTELTTDPVLLRFGEFVNHFAVVARQIMSSDRLTSIRVDELTDVLRRLLDTIPETLQFNANWTLPETTLPDLSAIATVYFCKAHTYIILLNRQRIEKHTTPAAIPIGKNTTLAFQAVNRPSSSNLAHEIYLTSVVPRGRTLVLASSEALISAFMFFYHKHPAALIDWTVAQQAFNSCMILLLDAIEYQTITTGAFKAEQAFVVFKELHENNVHKLAGLAVERISFCLHELRRQVTQPSGVPPQTQGHAAMQGTGHNEATRALDVADTVMGHTGMFLLEDPSQQTVPSEGFASMAWNSPDISTESEENYQASLHLGGRYQKEAELSRKHVESIRSRDVMQGLRRSTTLRSAPTRYVTLLEDDHMQPHHYTAPNSPVDFSMLHSHQLKNTIDRRKWQNSRGNGNASPPNPYIPERKVAASGDSQDDMVWHHGWGQDESGGGHEDGIRSSAWSDSRDVSHGSQRHNSYPALPSLNAHPPLLRPAFSSPNNVERPTMVRNSRNATLQATVSAEHTPFHPSQRFPQVSETPAYAPFFPRCVAPPMSSIAEIAPGFSSAIHEGFYEEQGQIIPALVAYSSHTTACSTLTPMTESIDMGDWTRYARSEGLD